MRLGMRMSRIRMMARLSRRSSAVRRTATCKSFALKVRQTNRVVYQTFLDLNIILWLILLQCCTISICYKLQRIDNTRPPPLTPHIQDPKEPTTLHISRLSRSLTLPEENHIIIHYLLAFVHLLLLLTFGLTSLTRGYIHIGPGFCFLIRLEQTSISTSNNGEKGHTLEYRIYNKEFPAVVSSQYRESDGNLSSAEHSRV